MVSINMQTLYHLFYEGIFFRTFLNNVQIVFIYLQIIFYPKAVHLITDSQKSKILNKRFNATWSESK